MFTMRGRTCSINVMYFISCKLCETEKKITWHYLALFFPAEINQRPLAVGRLLFTRDSIQTNRFISKSDTITIGFTILINAFKIQNQNVRLILIFDIIKLNIARNLIALLFQLLGNKESESFDFRKQYSCLFIMK